MKVFSLHRYDLPDACIVPQGESEVGKMSEHAKKHFDKLVAAGIVKVLDAPKASQAAKAPPPAPPPARAEVGGSHDADAPVDAASKRRRARED